MKVDPTKLLHLIATKPQIRTMELADRLDCEITDIDAALEPLLAAGKILAVPVTAPSGRPATGYRLSEAVRVEQAVVSQACTTIDRAIAYITEHGTARAAELHAHLGLRANDLVSRELSAAITDGRLVVKEGNWTLDTSKAAEPEPKSELNPEVKSEPQAGPGRITRALRATTYLATTPGNRATNEQIRDAIGLGPGDSPSPYLRDALKDGRLKRDGSDWVLGETVKAPFVDKFRPAADPAPRVEQPAASGPLAPTSVVAAAPSETIKSTVVGDVFVSARGDAALRTAVAAIAAVVSPAFRCGIWSDGILELQRGGQVVATLTREECAQVVEFLESRAA